MLSQDPLSRISLCNTSYFVVVTVPAGVVLSLLIAMAMNQKIRGVVFYRTAFFLPVVSSTVAIALIWEWLYKPQYGLLNSVLGMVGVPPVRWLANPTTAMPAIMIVSIWRGLGFNMVIFLAGLQAMPVGKMGLQFRRRFWEEDDRIFGGITDTNLDIGTIFYPSYGFHGASGLLIGYYNYFGDSEAYAALTPRDFHVTLCDVAPRGRSVNLSSGIIRLRGVDVDAFAPRLSWIFNTHMNFFEEIAKYRAPAPRRRRRSHLRARTPSPAPPWSPPRACGSPRARSR